MPETCGCEWESLPDPEHPSPGYVPGSRKRLVKRCPVHAAEEIVRQEARNAAEDIVEQAENYDDLKERLLFLGEAADCLTEAEVELRDANGD